MPLSWCQPRPAGRVLTHQAADRSPPDPRRRRRGPAVASSGSAGHTATPLAIKYTSIHVKHFEHCIFVRNKFLEIILIMYFMKNL